MTSSVRLMNLDGISTLDDMLMVSEFGQRSAVDAYFTYHYRFGKI